MGFLLFIITFLLFIVIFLLFLMIFKLLSILREKNILCDDDIHFITSFYLEHKLYLKKKSNNLHN